MQTNVLTPPLNSVHNEQSAYMCLVNPLAPTSCKTGSEQSPYELDIIPGVVGLRTQATRAAAR